MTTTDLFFNSSDFATKTPHDFVFSSLECPTAAHYTLNLKGITFPNLYPSIKTGINDQLQVQIGTTVYAITLAEGYYDGFALATALQVQIQALPGMGASTVTYSSTTSKLTITWASVGPFLVNATPSSNGQPKNPVERLLQVCGFLTRQLYVQTASLTSLGPVRLYGTSYVDVCINVQTKSYHSGSGTFFSIGRVFLTVPYGQIQVYVNVLSDRGQTITSEAMQQLRLFLVDEWGQPFVVPENQTVGYHLKLFPPDS